MGGWWLGLAACADFPRDAADSLARIEREGVLRVGYEIAPPWVEAGDPPGGLEPELVEAFARERGVRVEWTAVGTASLIPALAHREIDLAVGGYTTDQPWGGRVGQSRPYLRVGLGLGVAPGLPEPRTWRDVEVAVHPGRPGAAAAVRRVHATPVAADPAEAPVAAAYEPELRGMGFRPARRLERQNHVVLLIPGENALALTLDRFLHAREAWAEGWLAAGGAR